MAHGFETRRCVGGADKHEVGDRLVGGRAVMAGLTVW